MPPANAELALGLRLLELTQVLRLQFLHDRHLHGARALACRPAHVKVANDRVGVEDLLHRMLTVATSAKSARRRHARCR